MSRACVIVLDAVGAGELPDAADWGDEGSDTLGNVARAVGGLDLPNLEALGPRQHRAARGLPAAAVRAGGRGTAGRALEGEGHHRGPLGADGRRHPDPVPHVSLRLPRRGDRPVHEPHRARGDRQQARVGHGDHPGARRGAPADREVDRLHVGRLGLPDRGARGDDPARGALRRMPDRAGDPHGQARGRAGHRAPVRRRAGPLRAHAEPARLLARAAPPELPDGDPRRRSHGLRRREDLRHLRRVRHRRVVPDQVERRGDQPDDRADARTSTRGSSS